MRQAPLRLEGCSTFNRQDPFVITRAEDGNHASPIDDAIPTRTTNGCAGDFAFLSLRLR